MLGNGLYGVAEWARFVGKTVVSKAGNARSFPPHTWSVMSSISPGICIDRAGGGGPGWEDSESAAVLDACSSCSFFSLPSLSSRSRIFVIVARTHKRTLCAQESFLNLLLRCKARSFHATAVPRNCAFLFSLSLSYDVDRLLYTFVLQKNHRDIASERERVRHSERGLPRSESWWFSLVAVCNSMNGDHLLLLMESELCFQL